MEPNTLFEHPHGRYTRWFTFENPEGKKGAGAIKNHGHKGDAVRTLQPGETVTLMDCAGPGILQQMWFTYSGYNEASHIRTMWIEIFWEGEENPAVSAPMDDFFCRAAWPNERPFQNALFSSPEGRSFNCFVPMPFKKAAKVTLRNGSAQKVDVFYCLEATFGMELPPDLLYFHTLFQPERKTSLGVDFEILPKITGTGRYLGTNVLVRDGEGNSGTWFGEGEVKIYLDGDTEYPTLAGTGAEDYVLTAWGQGEFNNLYSGCTLYTTDAAGRMVTAFYRLHIPCPVYFSEDCRVTLQQMGGGPYTQVRRVMNSGAKIKLISGNTFGGKYYWEDDIDVNDPDLFYCNFLREDYVSAIAYFYLDRPVL